MFQLLESIALDSALNQWMGEAVWLWPVLEIIHFIGLTLLLGSLIIIDLRLAGHFRRFSLSATHQLIPLALAGFMLNLGTGTLFFYGDPQSYSVNIGFQVKMLLILLAGLNAVFYYWKLHPQLSAWETTGTTPVLARTVAWASLSLWFGVLLCGRLIAYLGTGYL